MSNPVKLTPPLSEAEARALAAGDEVLITGVIYTARDAAHKRLLELIEQGGELPLDLQGQIIYYVGPTPASPGRATGSAGPTTSSRMDQYTPQILAQGIRAVIGKGDRSTGGSHGARGAWGRLSRRSRWRRSAPGREDQVCGGCRLA